MGTGKSTIGELLAKELHVPFIDLDVYIEKIKGKSVQDIFATEGEKSFRKAEKKSLHSLTQDNMIVACGGGTPCFYDNMDWMNNHGITLYLQSSIDSIYNRLEKESKSRPLIADKTKEEIEELMVVREFIYLKSQYYINGNKSPEEVVKTIKSFLY